MTISDKLFDAILSMDSYNRGYNAAIKFGNESGNNSVDDNGTKIGTATITKNSSDEFQDADQAVGFYAIAYDYNGETIISYRGTDDPTGLVSGGDIVNGWVIGAGDVTDNQAEFAFEFYNKVATTLNGNVAIDPRLADISVTGHSLGGGLAGLVATVYNQDTNVFDNMPFEDAVVNAYSLSSLSNPNYNEHLRDVIYQGGSPWSPSDLTAGSVRPYSVENEALYLLREGEVSSDFWEAPYSLGDNVDLVSGLDTVAAHSMSTLVIRMFADESDLIANRVWENSAKYFWPVLYDSTFAQQIGMDQIDGTAKDNQDHAAILRGLIAYSAIDEGALVFGDTGIRAFYDDANNLGAAITSVQNDGTNTLIQTIATDISEVFVHFVGQLALQKIVRSADSNLTEEDGVLTYTDHTNNQNITINFSDAYWNDALNTTQHYLDTARGNFIISVLNTLSINSDDILDLTGNAWGRDSYHVFDRVVLTTTDGGTSVIEDSSYFDSTKASLFIGGSGSDQVTGSSGKDFIIGSGGQDSLYGGAGNDILVGGAGADYLDGGTNSASSFEKDIVDYSTQGSTITVVAHDTKENTFLVTDENGITDEIINFELIKAGNGTDTLDLRSTSINAFDIKSTGTIHTIPFDWGNGSKAFEFEGFDQILLNDLGSIVKLNGIGNINIIGGDGTDTVKLSAGGHDISYLYWSAHEDGLLVEADKITNLLDGTTYSDIEIFQNVGYAKIEVLGHEYKWVDSTPVLQQGMVLNYSDYQGALTFDLANDQIYGTGNSAGEKDVVYQDDVASLIGTNFGDTVFYSDFVDSYFSGTGNDTLQYVSQNGEIRSILNYYYTGGDDFISSAFKIFLPADVTTSNVQITNSSGNYYITVNGYGTITVDGPAPNVYLHDENGDAVAFVYDNMTSSYSEEAIPGGYATNESDTLLNVARGFDGDDVMSTDKTSGFSLWGGFGNDTLTGGSGNDKLHGGSGNDILSGGSGNDTLYAGTGTDSLNGGSGIDHASYAYNNGAIYLDLSQSGQNVDKNYDGITTQYSDTLTAIENATGTVYSDIFIGDSNDNEFHGLEGDDQYTGGLGADTFYIGNGLDDITDFDGSEDKISIEHLEASDTSEIEIIYTNSGSETIAAIYIAATGEHIANVHLPLGGQIPQEALEFNSYSEPVFNPEPGDNTSNIDNGELILSDNVDYHHSQHIVIRNPGSATGGITGWGDNPYDTDIPESLWNQIVTAWSFGETDKFLYGGSLDAFETYAYVGSSYTTISVQSDDPYVGALFGTATHSGSDEGSSITLPVPSNRGNGNDDTFVFYANNKYATSAIIDTVVEDVNAGFDTVVIEGATSDDIYYSWTNYGELVVNFEGFPNYKIYIQGDVHGEYGSDVTERIEQIILKSASGTEIIDIADGLELHGISGISDITNKGTIENDIIYGSDANDDIRGNSGDDTLFGQDGADTLYAGLGDDILSGGLGDDTLKGESGDDTYVWSVGDGNDLLWENGGIDQLVLHNVVWNDIRFEYETSGHYLLIHIGDETISVLNHFSSDATSSNTYDHLQIESLVLDDGTVKGLTTGFTFTGTSSDETLRALKNQDTTLMGMAGDDYLYGNAYSDTLIGGIGNDTLKGEGGDDSYIWSVGDGNDQITDTSGNDTLVLQGVLATDITYAQSGNNLQIQIGSETITNASFFQSGGAYRIESISLDDGSTINLDEIFNTAPDAKDDLISVDMDDVISGNILSNNGNGADTDPEGQALTVVAGTYATAHGSITLLANGDFTYTPDTGYSGLDSYTYTLQDVYGETDTANINITVTVPNAVNTINGTASNDTLNGDANGISDDTIIGYAGNDTLNGKLGNDSYEWSVGDGNDTINETGGVDQIVLHGILASEVSFGRGGSANRDLKINIGSETITVVRQFYSDDLNNSNYDTYQVESILLDDGTTIDLTGAVPLTGTAANDTIYGLEQQDNYMLGLAGVDTLNGYGFNDTLIGGLGNDTLNGGLGNDTYEWSVGDGNDKITESGGIDQLVLHGVVASDITFSRGGSYNRDLKINIGSETITLDRQLYSDDLNNSNYDTYHVESLLLDDGTVIDLTGAIALTGTAANESIYGLEQQDNYILGLGGNDTLNGYGFDDTLIGGLGNDTLNGGLGNDTYEWSVGDGDDKITETGGIDQLVLHGVVESDIRFEKAGSYNRDLRVHIDDETITLDRQLYSDDLNNSNYDTYHVESLLLDDGTVIDLTGSLTFTGTDANETVYGLEQIGSTLYGLAGNDTLNAFNANDVLYGGDGSDYLYGGTGDDILYGGAGVDMLYGQGGADTFVFEADSAFLNSDNIQDFDLASGDKLDISDLLIGYDPLNDAITDFVQITESGSNSYLSVDADGGADNFVQIAYIYNETGLTDEAALEASGNLIAA